MTARRKAIIRVTPTLGMVSHWWVQAVTQLAQPMNTIKAETFQTIEVGKVFVHDEVGGLIAEARNEAVARAMSYETDETEIEGIFWLDDDVVLCSPAALRKLYWYDVPIASGVYFTKEEGPFAQPLLFSGRSSGLEKFTPAQDNEEKSKQIWMGSMGLSLVKMEVYRKIAKELDLGTDRKGNPQFYKTTSGQLKNDGDCLDVGGTEDTYFMDLANKVGYSCLVDFTKHCFGFHFCSTKKRGYPEVQWDQYVKARAGQRVPVEWPQQDGTIVTWK